MARFTFLRHIYDTDPGKNELIGMAIDSSDNCSRPFDLDFSQEEIVSHPEELLMNVAACVGPIVLGAEDEDSVCLTLGSRHTNEEFELALREAVESSRVSNC